MASVGRNDPCPCGSGKKAKRCCYRLGGAEPESAPAVPALARSGSAPAARTPDAVALFREGAALLDQGRLDEAAARLERALALRPKFAEAQLSLGQLRWMQGQPEAAASHLERGLALRPELAEAHNNLGLLQQALGRSAAALASFRRALALKPDFVWAHSNLGNALQAQHDLPGAIASYRRALALDPRHAESWINLGNTLAAQDDADGAVESYRRALALRPELAVTHVNLATALQAQGDYAAAALSYRKALALAPDHVDAQSGLVFLANIDPACPPAQRLAEARRYGVMASARARPYAQWRVDAAPGGAPPRPLRVGLVSPDLRAHPVGFFMESIVAHLDRERIELVAYATLPQEDETTARIKPRMAAWRSIHGLTDEAAAAAIHADGVHVLVDLAGHTAHNRLPLFAWKPAPVQASWLGYFATTGVPALDFVLADRVSVPEAHRAQYTEALRYLPDTRFCFTPPGDAARFAVTLPPALADGSINFACFQNPLKITDAVLDAWGRIFAALPRARLRLQGGAFRHPAACGRFTERLRRVGIAAQRLALVPGMPRGDYLRAHAEVDIILDTFPYSGATTTCEALWMGVPTLTLAGETMVARQGASLLACVGLDEWIACDEADYVARALGHAADLGRLAALRSSLRERALASPLFDAASFARHLEAALFGMWTEQTG